METAMSKRKGRPGPGEPAEHAVRLYLPTVAHRKLRVEAAKRDLSMSAYAQAIVLEALGFGSTSGTESQPPKKKE